MEIKFVFHVYCRSLTNCLYSYATEERAKACVERNNARTNTNDYFYKKVSLSPEVISV